MIETLKDAIITAGKGGGAIALSLWEVLPELVRLGILIGTLIHIVIKIRKDLK